MILDLHISLCYMSWLIIIFVCSRTCHSLTNGTSPENVLDQKCFAWQRCFEQCNNNNNPDVTGSQCTGLSHNDDTNTSCACSNLRCARIGNVCIHHCDTHPALNRGCVECLTRNISGDCVQACSDSNACAVRDCDDSSCHTCLIGHFGDSCDKKCSSNCPGACNKDNGYCLRCPSGRFGPGCDLDCPLHCHRNSCFPYTGHCKSCEPGFVGTTCNQTCKDGHYGRKCGKRCSQNCKSGQCHPASGRCEDGCNPGFFSVFCDKMCPSGTYGEGCLAHCPVTCDTGADTSPCNHVTGACLSGCDPGFHGEHCEVICPQGKFGKNCDTNCSDQCFLGVCNSFSGHCLRCVSGREGPYCEDIIVRIPKRDRMLGSEVSTDQVILIFIMLFAVGGCLWFVLAASMYHRRKLMWEKLWKTGKLPRVYRLPRVWKQKLERASMASVDKLYGLRRSLGSPQIMRPQRRRRLRRRLLYSSEGSDNTESSGDTLTTVGDINDDEAEPPHTDDVLEVKGQGGGDVVIPKVGTGVDALEEVNDKARIVQNVADGERVDMSWLSRAEGSPIKALAIRLSPDPTAGPSGPIALYRSGTESSAIDLGASHNVHVGSTTASDSWSRRPLRLLKATTRTRAATRREIVSSSARFSITTEEARTTTTSTVVKTDKTREEGPGSDTTTETSTQAETDTHASTETETETESTSEGKTEGASEESVSASSASTTTVTEIAGPSAAGSRKTEMGPKFTFPIRRLVTSPERREQTQPRLPPRYQPKRLPPARHTGLLRKGYDLLSRTIPIRIRGSTPRDEQIPKPYSPEKRHMSSRFLLTRLDDWRRVREKQLDVTGGVVEVNDERAAASDTSSTAASSNPTLTKTSTSATTSASWRPSLTDEIGGTTTTGAYSSASKGTTTKASAATTTSRGQSGRRRRTYTPASEQTSHADKTRSDRSSGSRAWVRSPTTHSRDLTSLTASNTITSRYATPSESGNTSSVTRHTTVSRRCEDKTASREFKRHQRERTRRRDSEKIHWPQVSPVGGFPSLTEQIGTISPQFPKMTLQDLHRDAMKKLARFGGPPRADRRNSSRRLGKEKGGQVDVTSNQRAREHVEGFWKNASPSLEVLSSTQDVSQTIGNQSSTAPSFSSGATSETGR